MSLSDPHLTEVAIDELKPRTGEIGRPRLSEGHNVNIPDHHVGIKMASVALDEDIQKEIALYSRAYEADFGRPPVEERMLRDLIHRGMMSDQNYRTWKNNKKRELKSEAQLKKGE